MAGRAQSLTVMQISVPARRVRNPVVRVPSICERLPAAFAPPSRSDQQLLFVAGREISARIEIFRIRHNLFWRDSVVATTRVNGCARGFLGYELAILEEHFVSLPEWSDLLAGEFCRPRYDPPPIARDNAA
jgi:hypothetical protein